MISITKKTQFSAAHFYWNSDYSETKNEQIFHACSNRHGHGHNYEVYVTVAGEIDPQTGMVVNLKDLKEILQTQILDPLDHKHLNHQVPFFKDRIPTLENITYYLWDALSPDVSDLGLQLQTLKVVENHRLYAEYSGPQKRLAQLHKRESTPMIYNPPEAPHITSIPQTEVTPEDTLPVDRIVHLTCRYDFSASHRLFNPEFSDEQNEEVFKQCNNPNGHGHNYELDVTIAGTPTKETGMVMDIMDLDELVNQHIIRHVDHKHLNLDVDFFEGVIPTAENIVAVFWQKLKNQLPKGIRLYRLKLYESKNNTAEYYGETAATESELLHA
ncbi:MAG: 6-carboxytetrahydropterin synthase [Vampirovibrio sp.]|nr:6-carboxytetrahydropterin synthase [Vampirovibrio sp.]